MFEWVNPLTHVQFAIQSSFMPSIPVLFRVCINLVQFTWSKAFCQSTKQTHSSSSISKVHSATILIIPIASLVLFPLLNPNCSSPSTFSIFLSILLLSIFAIISAVMCNEADCAMVAAFCSLCLLHFISYSFSIPHSFNSFSHLTL